MVNGLIVVNLSSNYSGLEQTCFSKTGTAIVPTLEELMIWACQGKASVFMQMHNLFIHCYLGHFGVVNATLRELQDDQKPPQVFYDAIDSVNDFKL